MSSGRINNKRFKKVSYEIKEFVNQEKKNVQLKRHLQKNSLYQLNKEIVNSLDDNFDIIKCLHLLLSNCSTLTKKQKFEFCNSQRYFMKLYLKEMLRKI